MTNKLREYIIGKIRKYDTSYTNWELYNTEYLMERLEALEKFKR